MIIMEVLAELTYLFVNRMHISGSVACIPKPIMVQHCAISHVSLAFTAIRYFLHHCRPVCWFQLRSDSPPAYLACRSCLHFSSASGIKYGQSALENLVCRFAHCSMFVPFQRNFLSFLQTCFSYALILFALHPALSNCVFPPERFQVQCPENFERWYSQCDPRHGPHAYYIVCFQPVGRPLGSPSRSKELHTRYFNRPGRCADSEICVTAPYRDHALRRGGAYCVPYDVFHKFAVLATTTKKGNRARSVEVGSRPEGPGLGSIPGEEMD